MYNVCTVYNMCMLYIFLLLIAQLHIKLHLKSNPTVSLITTEELEVM